MSDTPTNTEVTETLLETGAVATNTEPTAAEVLAAATAEAKDSETKPEAEVKPKEEILSPKFAALARKEKQMREREKAVAAREKQYEARLAALEEQYKGKEAEVGTKMLDPELLRTSPKAALEKAGVTVEALLDMLANDGKQTPDMMLTEAEKRFNAKIAALEEKLSKKEADEAEAKYTETIQNFVGEITDFVNTNNEYELIRANDAIDLVYEVIEERHAETGELLSIKEAADAVENHFLDEAKRHLQLNKIKGIIQPTEVATGKKDGKQSVTLSNTQASQVPKTGARKMSDEESKAEAAKLIRWDD